MAMRDRGRHEQEMSSYTEYQKGQEEKQKKEAFGGEVRGYLEGLRKKVEQGFNRPDITHPEMKDLIRIVCKEVACSLTVCMNLDVLQIEDIVCCLRSLVSFLSKHSFAHSLICREITNFCWLSMTGSKIDPSETFI